MTVLQSVDCVQGLDIPRMPFFKITVLQSIDCVQGLDIHRMPFLKDKQPWAYPDSIRGLPELVRPPCEAGSMGVRISIPDFSILDVLKILFTVFSF